MANVRYWRTLSLLELKTEGVKRKTNQFELAHSVHDCVKGDCSIDSSSGLCQDIAVQQQYNVKFNTEIDFAARLLLEPVGYAGNFIAANCDKYDSLAERSQ